MTARTVIRRAIVAMLPVVGVAAVAGAVVHWRLPRATSAVAVALPGARTALEVPARPEPEWDIEPILEQHLFRESREPAPRRYRASGPAAPVQLMAASPPRTPPLELRGTAARGNGGGIAVLMVMGTTTRAVRVGEEVGGLRLVRVERGVATLRGADTTVVLKLLATP